MKRRELMAIISIAAGLTTGLHATTPAFAGKQSAVEHSNSQGYAASGNPMAAGGPLNPGKGNPHNIY